MRAALRKTVLTCCLLIVACTVSQPETGLPPATDIPTARIKTPAPDVIATPIPFDTRSGAPLLPLGPSSHECLSIDEVSPKPPHLRYGINVFLFGTDTDRVLTLTDIAGFEWIRQQIHWRDVEGIEGQFAWETLDNAVKLAREYNFRIMLSVVRSPGRATIDGGDGLPDDTAAFASFMSHVAHRYRGRVQAYEIWNEPNLAHENGGIPARPQEYLPVLKAAYTAIKEVDTCALVLSAPLASTINPDPAIATDDLPFYEELYTLDNGAFLDYADIVAVHPGGGPYHPSAHWPEDNPDESASYFRHIERVRDIMVRNNDSRQVWITEVGWSTARAQGAPPPVSQQEQADYLRETLWFIRHNYSWVSAVFVWNLNFAVITQPGDEKATFGLLNSDWTTRPSYLALQHEVQALRDIDQPPFVSPGARYQYAWTFPGRGKIRTSPVIAKDGTIYATSDSGMVYAVTPLGSLRWSFQAPAATRNTPVQSPSGTLYFGDSAGMLTAVMPDDGAVAWSIRLRGPARGSPIYHNDTIFIVTRDGEIQALNTFGQEAWWHDLHTESTPLALSQLTNDQDTDSSGLVIGTVIGTVYKLSTAGQVLWQKELHQELRAAPVTAPNGSIYIATANGRLIALDQQGQGIWQTDLHEPIATTLLFGQDGILYSTTRNGTLVAIDSANGSVRWRFETGSSIDAKPVQDDQGTIYVGTDNEELLAINSTGELLWQAHVRGMIRSQPVIDTDGTLFLTTLSGRVYAFKQMHAPIIPK